MDWVPTTLFLAALVGGAALVGDLTRAWTRSLACGIVAGLLSLAAALVHTLHVIVLALGENYEPDGYDRFVEDAWVPLLIAYMAAPALLVAGARVLWPSVSARSRSTS